MATPYVLYPSQAFINDLTNRGDQEIEVMKINLRNINSKVHRAISSVPEIDKVFEETQKTPIHLENY